MSSEASLFSSGVTEYPIMVMLVLAADDFDPRQAKRGRACELLLKQAEAVI